ncbi:MAG: ATP-dependent sacrificial sulfur transferase LarE [Bryobacteraceae bacterium]|nr:ATP-dependent sacrificial sulfur transferase LarE [Bryobacteraceae bacterium]
MATLVSLSLPGTPPAPLEPALLAAKQERLFAILRSLRRVLIAYSGGADSAYLAWAAQQVLGDNCLALTADSASMPDAHKRDAERFAQQHGIRHEYVPTLEFENPLYAANNADRCFYCKEELFRVMENVAAERGFDALIYGVNQDDLGDHRPGQNAAKIYSVKAPLVEAGLTKAELRELSRLAGLETWDRPASACLSSRIPYGTAVTRENVRTVEVGEEAIRALGFSQFRVRFHEKLVRVEIDPAELPKALSLGMAQQLVKIFKPLGFHYVTLDLEGYRQGSGNEVLH